MTRQPSALRIGVVSDIHFTTDLTRELRWHGPFDIAGVLPRLRAGLDWFADQEVDALALLGDLSNDGDDEALDAVLTCVAEHWSGIALVVAGNHDTLERAGAVDEAIRRIGASGLAPAGAPEIEFGGLRITGPEPDPTALDGGPLVLLSHWPLFSRRRAFAAAGLAYSGVLPGAAAIDAALAAREAPTLILAGHVHARDSFCQGRALQMTVGALVEAPFELTVIDVLLRDRALSVERQTLQLPGPAPSGPMPALAPTWEALTSGTAVAGHRGPCRNV